MLICFIYFLLWNKQNETWTRTFLYSRSRYRNVLAVSLFCQTNTCHHQQNNNTRDISTYSLFKLIFTFYSTSCYFIVIVVLFFLF